jgi:hypothetical protein
MGTALMDADSLQSVCHKIHAMGRAKNSDEGEVNEQSATGE